MLLSKNLNTDMYEQLEKCQNLPHGTDEINVTIFQINEMIISLQSFALAPVKHFEGQLRCSNYAVALISKDFNSNRFCSI